MEEDALWGSRCDRGTSGSRIGLRRRRKMMSPVVARSLSVQAREGRPSRVVEDSGRGVDMKRQGLQWEWCIIRYYLNFCFTVGARAPC